MCQPEDGQSLSWKKKEIIEKNRRNGNDAVIIGLTRRVKWRKRLILSTEEVSRGFYRHPGLCLLPAVDCLVPAVKKVCS
ncbi:hypothetical protein JOB18_020737 [Solea senegalensis]|uniref:Uncharacterized protein n=1 Tax=Solea senegalensis TaxID=28829 RepID=A0AAV6T6J5_SOLSE|nr:hypothetical protein JOB18_020737 [Solea senegalensis]